MSDLLLGVDGGNTKTIALVARFDGTLVGLGTGDRADIHNATSPAEAIDEIARAVAAALETARARPTDLESAAFSLAGADWEEDFTLLRRQLPGRLGLTATPIVVNDAIGAIRCGTDDGVGVAAVCGTHGAAGARNAAGDVYHFGFWPDDTGGRALAAQGLAAVWRAELGVGPPTSLTGRALAWWAVADPIELLHLLTRLDTPSIPLSDRDLFAEAVLDEADAGDAVARGIVELAGSRLGDYARVSAERTGQDGFPFRLVLCGGVFRHDSMLLRESVLSRLPDAVPVYPSVDPVVGALLLAADAVGASPTLDRLRPALLSWPGRHNERSRD